MQVKCIATKRNGSACQGRPVLESEYCVAHHEHSAVWRSQGGKAKSNIERAYSRFPEGLRPVVDGLLQAFEETHKAELNPRAATAMASVASSLIRVAEFALLNERLEAIESELRSRGELDE